MNNEDIMNLSDSEIENIANIPSSENEKNTENNEDNKNTEDNSENIENIKNNSSNKEEEDKEIPENNNNNNNNNENSTNIENTEEDKENREDKKDKESSEEKQNTENIENIENTDEKSELEKYKETYNLIFKPFKANGKEIQIKTPEEAVKLMQMGANYTKKMQTLQPHLHVVRVLEKNNLLDKEKLNYLIDLDKKNPEAIKKLLKESNIDPLMIDMDQKSNYKPNDYNIPNNEVALKNIIEDYDNDSEAQLLFDSIITKWDDISKRAIYDDPSIMNSLITQYKNGYYKRVVDEIERRRIFGEFNNVPFAEAYIRVGRELDAQAASALSKQNFTQNNVNLPLGTKAIIAKEPVVNNSSKAKSAGIARNTINKNNKTNNFDLLSDEEFEKIQSFGKF